MNKHAFIVYELIVIISLFLRHWMKIFCVVRHFHKRSEAGTWISATKQLLRDFAFSGISLCFLKFNCSTLSSEFETCRIISELRGTALFTNCRHSAALPARWNLAISLRYHEIFVGRDFLRRLSHFAFAHNSLSSTTTSSLIQMRRATTWCNSSNK